MSDSGRSIYQDYKFLEPLAEGGMGTVFLAEDRRNNGRCVIKQLRTMENATAEEIQEAERLFDREASLLKTLDHPGIVSFMDSYRTHEDGRSRFFLVMSYVQGHNLETILQNHGKFSLDDTTKVGIQICEVLEHLHGLAEPIIYRDLKPSNLMLTPEGQVIFIDFGIARVLMSDKNAATRVVTAGYSPPEQYFGRPEFRSDLYALGATLYHLVTGVRPRPLITSVPSQQIPDILPSFDELIREMTAHSPLQRPESARTVRHRLYRIFQQIHPDFEIPDEAFSSDEKTPEDQFISQKIMKSGLKAAITAHESWPQARGPEFETYTDENMPSTLRKLAESWQRLSSTRIPKLDSDSKTTNADDFEQMVAAESNKQSQATSVTAKLKNTFDKHESNQTVWNKLFKWFKGE